MPQTEDEIVKAVTTGSLEESSIFDAKKELPTKNAELAKDVAAMANDGGVLIYGIDEDPHGRPTVLNPIVLVDQPERITSIVQTSIAEPPVIKIFTIPTIADPAKGYIIVAVPPSERAPHMVVVKGDNRYYGRTATGNYPLTEAEVARLYERRRRWDIDRDALLVEQIRQAPFPAHPDFAFLHCFAQPVSRGERMLERMLREGQTIRGSLFDLVNLVTASSVFPGDYMPDFYSPSNWTHLTDGFLMPLQSPGKANDPRAPADTLNLQVDFDGSGHLFCGRAAEREGERFLFFPSIVAGNTTRFLALLGKLYEKAKYIGMVDLGVAITGLKGSFPEVTNVRWMLDITPYDRDEYRRTTRVSALTLSENPQNVAKDLLMPLFNAVSQGKLDPFPKTPTTG